MNSVNVKKTLLSECGTKYDSKNTLLPHEFRVFREQISFLAEVSKNNEGKYLSIFNKLNASFKFI